jgi:hypothetical protein
MSWRRFFRGPGLHAETGLKPTSSSLNEHASHSLRLVPFQSLTCVIQGSLPCVVDASHICLHSSCHTERQCIPVVCKAPARAPAPALNRTIRVAQYYPNQNVRYRNDVFFACRALRWCWFTWSFQLSTRMSADRCLYK